MFNSKERAKEIVSRLRKNINIHTEEWDEVRYLENKLAQALDQAREEQRERDAKIAEAHIRIRWSGPDRRERNLEAVIAQAIRQDKPIGGGEG